MLSFLVSSSVVWWCLVVLRGKGLTWIHVTIERVRFVEFFGGLRRLYFRDLNGGGE